MNKQAKEVITNKLMQLREELNTKIIHNKWNMKILVDEQTSLKRQRVEYTKLLRIINGTTKEK